MNFEDRKRFEAWLKERGAEILPPTNEYEALRFKGRETGVIYTSGKISGKYTAVAINAFRRNKKWSGRPVKMKRKLYYKEKLKLLDRDGDKCFFCTHSLGEDITLEHLIPLTAGGKNLLSNMVLAHEECNKKMGHKTIVEKVNFVIKNRLSKQNESRTKETFSKIIFGLYYRDRKKRNR